MKLVAISRQLAEAGVWHRIVVAETTANSTAKPNTDAEMESATEKILHRLEQLGAHGASEYVSVHTRPTSVSVTMERGDFDLEFRTYIDGDFVAVQLFSNNVTKKRKAVSGNKSPVAVCLQELDMFAQALIKAKKWFK